MRRNVRKRSTARRAHFSHCPCSHSLLVTLLKALAIMNMRKLNLILNFVEEVLALALTSR